MSGVIEPERPVTLANVILGQRGNILLEINKFKFKKQRDMATGESKWRCYKSTCPASLKTIGPDYSITQRNFNHNHEPVSERALERQKLSGFAKQLATEVVHEQPGKLLQDILSMTNTQNLLTSDLSRVKRNMYNARKKSVPVPTESHHDVHEALPPLCPETILKEEDESYPTTVEDSTVTGNMVDEDEEDPPYSAATSPSSANECSGSSVSGFLPTSSHHLPSKRPAAVPPNTASPSSENNRLDHTLTSSVKKCKSDLTEDSLDRYGKHIVDRLRQINPNQIKFVQKLISEVLFEAEMDALNPHFRVIDVEAHFPSPQQF